jgi:septal ring factor EnvC (AmiA/AmiB activator)
LIRTTTVLKNRAAAINAPFTLLMTVSGKGLEHTRRLALDSHELEADIDQLMRGIAAVTSNVQDEVARLQQNLTRLESDQRTAETELKDCAERVAGLEAKIDDDETVRDGLVFVFLPMVRSAKVGSY